jgi:large subunit ribosomal protein L18
MATTKIERRQKIKFRIRKKIIGTAEKPRMSVFRSNKHISVQLINDIKGETLVSATSLEKEIKEKKGIKKIEQAALVGKLIAQKSLEKGIKEVVFDRGGYLYHGRIKSLADAARSEGLKF